MTRGSSQSEPAPFTLRARPERPAPGPTSESERARLRRVTRRGEGHGSPRRPVAAGAALVALSVLGLASALAAPAAGQTSAAVRSAPQDEQKPASLEEMIGMSLEELLKLGIPMVEAVSRRAEKATDAPATVIVLTDQDIRLRGYSFLKDVFRDLPGMESTEMYFSEIGTSVPVRGVVGNNKIIVLINGMRVNPPGGEHLMLRSDYSLHDVERVEIAYGASSTLYGQDAISAVVNVVSRNPTHSSGAEAGVALGSPSRGMAWGSWRRKIGAGAFSLQLTAYGAELSDLSRSYPEEWAANYATWTEPRGGDGTRPDRWDRGLNATMRLSVRDSSLQVWHRMSSRSSSEARWPLLPRLDLARWDDMSTVAEGRNRLELAPGVALESALMFNRYEILPPTRYIFPASDTEWALWDYKYGLGTAISLEERVAADLGPRLHLDAGVVVGHYDIMPKTTIPGGVDRSQDVVSQGSRDGGIVYFTERGNPASSVTVGRTYNLVYQNFAGYVEGSWHAFEPLEFIAGIRVDKNTRFDDVPVSPRLAAIWQVGDRFTAKYIRTRAFVAPPPYFGYAVYQGEDRINIPNADLRPERASSSEVNLSYNGPRVMAGVSVYRNRQSDLLVLSDAQRSVNIVDDSIYFTPDPEAPPQKLVRNANAGSSEAVGGDVYARYTFSDVSGWASYSYVDFESEAEGMKEGLPGISAHNLRLGVTYSPLAGLYATASFSLRSTPHLLSRSPAILGTLEDEARSPHELGLHVVYAPRVDLELFANLRNVTNHRYALTSSDGPLMPQETFACMFGVRYVVGGH